MITNYMYRGASLFAKFTLKDGRPYFMKFYDSDSIKFMLFVALSGGLHERLKMRSLNRNYLTSIFCFIGFVTCGPKNETEIN